MPARKIIFPQLVTPKQFQQETGLPASLVRSIFDRVPRYPQPTNRIVVRRVDLERVLRDDPPARLREQRSA
jgi:hypothetical protein